VAWAKAGSPQMASMLGTYRKNSHSIKTHDYQAIGMILLRDHSFSASSVSGFPIGTWQKPSTFGLISLYSLELFCPHPVFWKGWPWWLWWFWSTLLRGLKVLLACDAPRKIRPHHLIYTMAPLVLRVGRSMHSYQLLFHFLQISERSSVACRKISPCSVTKSQRVLRLDFPQKEF